MAQQTPLYSRHLDSGAKMIDFFGYVMPVQYKGITHEHRCVRSSVGVFDLSHMGEIHISGKGADAYLNMVTTNNISSLKPGAIQYNLLTNENGGIIDDILIYREPEAYYLVVNASNKDKDYQWLLKQADKNTIVKDLSDETSLIAVQGRNAEAVVEQVFNHDFSQLKYYHFVDLPNRQATMRISRTGYTGEDGFEIYLDPQIAPQIWDKVLAAGESYQIQPIGLGARDTLRLEMRMPLYGNELTEEITPLEAGLSRVVDFTKSHFIGKEALLKQKEEGISKKLVGFELIDKGIVRHDYEIRSNESTIGYVTSGTISPITGKSIGLGYVDKQYAKVGRQILIKIRKKEVPAKIIKGRFVKIKK